MNIQTLANYASDFDEKVVQSGFSRDIEDFVSAIPGSVNNIVALRDIANKIKAHLDEIMSSDLPDELSSLLPKTKSQPFTQLNFLEKINTLINDKMINQDEFHTQLNTINTELQLSLNRNKNDIKEIYAFIAPYADFNDDLLAEARKAIVSIVFKEERTITRLGSFTKTISAWNRTLPLYHQILHSETPEDIEIIEVQNGSIDFLINLNLDVAINLAELFSVGFKCFGAYLAYKKMARPFIDNYFGNKRLLELENEREDEMLKNIGTAIEEKLREQYDESIQSGRNEITPSVDVMIKSVKDLVVSHIINGNDLKLLAVPESTEAEATKETNVKSDLSAASASVRTGIRMLPEPERYKLLSMYSSDNLE